MSRSEQPSPPVPKRFYFHTICGFIFPLGFAAYYLWTYLFWLQPSSDAAANIDRPLSNGTFIWWSWFITGAVGLNISNYALSGVKAGMMMDKRFRPTVDQFKEHVDRSWNKLGVWKIVATKLFARKKSTHIGRLWALLFLLSVLSWSFVLSGLTMEMYEGYKVGTTPGTDVVGANEDSLNKRSTYSLLRTTREAWSNGDEPRLPSGAALYVTSGDPITPNISTPNAIPSDAAAGLFLAPQAEVPVTGNTWLLKYNCTEVHRLDQLTILNRRINSSNPASMKNDVNDNSDENLHYFYTLDDGSSISALGQYLQLGNLNGFIEIGTSTGFLDLRRMVTSWGYDPHSFVKFDSRVYAGLDEEEVFEIDLWNNFVDYSLPPQPPTREKSHP